MWRRPLLAAEEAGDLEIVRVVGRALHRHRLADASLDADRGRLVVAPDLGAVAVERPLALELLEEVALARDTAGHRCVGRLRCALMTPDLALTGAVEARGDDGDHALLAEAVVEARPEDDV